MITADTLIAQEAAFARAFAAGDVALARDHYDPAVVYVSPTVRLFDWPRRIEGVERTLEFIALTIRRCEDIRYEAVERAIATGASHGRRSATTRARRPRCCQTLPLDDSGCVRPHPGIRGLHADTTTRHARGLRHRPRVHGH